MSLVSQGLLIYVGVYSSRLSERHLAAVRELNGLRLDWDAGRETAIGLESFREGTYFALNEGYGHMQQ